MTPPKSIAVSEIISTGVFIHRAQNTQGAASLRALSSVDVHHKGFAYFTIVFPLSTIFFLRLSIIVVLTPFTCHRRVRSYIAGRRKRRSQYATRWALRCCKDSSTRTATRRMTSLCLRCNVDGRRKTKNTPLRLLRVNEGLSPVGGRTLLTTSTKLSSRFGPPTLLTTTFI